VSTEAVRLTEKQFEVINQGNLELLPGMLAPGFVKHRTNAPDVDAEGYCKQIADVCAAYPDIQFTIDDTIAQGDKVAARWHFVGTLTGTSPTTNVVATGKKVHVTAISISHIKDGKVAETWEYADWSGFMKQLGYVFKPE
jgi:predicted ester cyclase